MIDHEKVIIIAGGGGALGSGIAQHLSKQGHRIVVLDRHKEVLAALPDHYSKYCCDLVNAEQTEAVVNEVCSRFNGIDVLINCTGQIHNELIFNFLAPVEKKHSMKNWECVIQNNLTATFLVTASVVEKMVAVRKKGLIINFSSVSAKGNAGQCAYSAAKAGVEAFTKAIAKELGPLGVRVVALAPGFIDVITTHAALSESKLQEWSQKTALRRLGEITNIFSAIDFIMSNDYMTACIIPIDGGLEL